MSQNTLIVRLIVLAATATGLIGVSPSLGAVVTVPTMDGDTLKAALNPSGLTINSVTITNGVAGQFGTYSNFETPPVTIGPGVVLSTGDVSYLTPGSPITQIMNSGGTTEFNAYGAGHIENFHSSNDVAALEVNFTLPVASPIKFDFIFGSTEYPYYTSNFTDAFLVFLNGTAPQNQITFDGNGNPVQVGSSFAGLLTTADQNTVFSNPYGLLGVLTTTSIELEAGSHTLLFEVGDVNDMSYNSAVFLANLRAEAGDPGTVPEPATLAMLGLGLLPICLRRRMRQRSVA